MKRRTAREKAMQSLFQLEINETSPEQAIQSVLEGHGNSSFLTSLVEGVTENLSEVDKRIGESLENWSMDRIATIEKTILRISVYEMYHLKDIPESVSINEAVELAKKYGNEKSGKFVNGVLSKIIHK